MPPSTVINVEYSEAAYHDDIVPQFPRGVPSVKKCIVFHQCRLVWVGGLDARGRI